MPFSLMQVSQVCLLRDTFRKVTNLSLHYLDNQKQQRVKQKVTEIETGRTKFESPFYYIKSPDEVVSSMLMIIKADSLIF